MNRVQPENVHSTIFTPQEYQVIFLSVIKIVTSVFEFFKHFMIDRLFQVELIDSCIQGNTVAVLASRSTRTFLVTMVTRELSYQTRR